MRRKTEIIIPLPLNISEQFKVLFEKTAGYKSPELFVREYSDVFVSHEGLCLHNARLLPYSTFNMNTSYDKSFGWSYYKLVLEQYLVCRFGKSLESIRLDANTKYAVIHTKWFNYSFWLTSSLVRLQMLYDSGKEFVLLYPEEWDNLSFIKESLRAFPGLKIKKIPPGVHTTVPRLLFPEVRPFTSCFSGGELINIRNYLLSEVTGKTSKGKFGKRIYLTREKAKFRKIDNEQELLDLLQGFGFSVIDFDDMDFWEQIECMQGAEIFVSIHGAGFANIMFMKQGSKVLELVNAKYAEVEYTFPFSKIAFFCGLKYFVQFGEPVNDKISLISPAGKIDENTSLVNQNIKIDIDILRNNINLLL